MDYYIVRNSQIILFKAELVGGCRLCYWAFSCPLSTPTQSPSPADPAPQLQPPTASFSTMVSSTHCRPPSAPNTRPVLSSPPKPQPHSLSSAPMTAKAALLQSRRQAPPSRFVGRIPMEPSQSTPWTISTESSDAVRCTIGADRPGAETVRA